MLRHRVVQRIRSNLSVTSRSSKLYRRFNILMEQNVADHGVCRNWRRKSEWSGPGSALRFLVLSMSFCAALGLNSEGLALLAFKRGVTADPKLALANWNASDENPCAWDGVVCNADQTVAELNIPKKSMRGRIAQELGNLSNLKRLNLHDNALFGLLPPSIFSSTLLRSLFLFNNNLSGILPSNVGQLRHLQHIDISGNGFVGGIPAEITRCQELLTLVLRGNDFSGFIPEGFGDNFTMLQSLDLSSNFLSGPIPPDLGKLTALQNMNLSRNRLGGSIPESLGDLSSFVRFDFSHNNLSGAIPRSQDFANQDPTAFGNNLGLCGVPLPNPCFPSAAPSPSAVTRRGGLSTKAIIAIVVGDSIGIFVLFLVFVYFLRRKSNCEDPKKGENGNASSENSARITRSWCWSCSRFPKDGSEASEKVEHGELIRLDADVKFDLEDLLRASAFVLGRSGVGIVYKALLEEGLAVAVRRLGEGGTKSYKEFESEVRLFGKIRHPNVVSLRAYYWAVDEKLLIHEFLPNGCLASALHARTPEAPVSTPLSWSERLKIAQGAARGLAYIHACGGRHKFVHKDIKPSNILLDANMDAKISDLGLARLQSLAGGGLNATKTEPGKGILSIGAAASLSQGESRGVGRRGHLPNVDPISPSSSYYPPEASEKKKATQKWDVYSFGVVLIELLTGKSPVVHLGTCGLELATWVRETVEERKPISEVLDVHLCSEISKLEGEFMEALQIALSCTSANPESRPAMSLVSNQLEQIGRRLEICD